MHDHDQRHDQRDDQLLALHARYQDLAGVYWHHSMQLLPDLFAKGGKSVADLELERTLLLDLIDLRGRSVMEIGSWTGYHAFEAKRAGAARVIATDKFAWASPHWRGRETFDLARDCLQLDIEAVEIDPTELPGPLQPVDVMLFLGVFYHMHEPVTILRKLCDLTRDLLVIETHQDLLDLARPAMAFYPRDTLQGDPSNWWGPNPQCMAELLESVGFPVVYYQQGTAGGVRGYYHAFRTEATARTYLRREADNATLFDLRSEAGRHAVFAEPRPDPALVAAACAAAQAEASRLGSEMQGLQARLEAARVEAAGLANEMQGLQAERAAAQAEAARLGAALPALQAELAAAQAGQSAVLASTSWRITAPLRRLVQLAR